MDKNSKEDVIRDNQNDELTRRAFRCLDESDTKELLWCLDKGFDINTHRLASYKSIIGLVEIDFKETVPSLAFRRENWIVLKTLLERYGSENLLMADRITKSPAKKMRTIVLQTLDRSWSGLQDKNFETDAACFCLWHLARPSALLIEEPASLPEISEISDFSTRISLGVWGYTNLPALDEFFKNCEALEQKNALSESVSETKEKKALQKKPSAL